MEDPTRGGRGRRAPYNTVGARVVEPIKPMVEILNQRYRELVTDYYDTCDPELLSKVASAIAPGAIATPPNCDQSQELETARQEVEILRAAMEHLQQKIEERNQVLNEALKMHSTHGTAIKRKIKKALEI